jgi:NADH:ubiquinone oxidoreductase subunit E/ferredoxin/NAD-dependent dihydropyrimidine dehydrogenase PreA subunit
MPMDALRIRIDGLEIAGQKGSTIFEAAERAGIKIPTLCHHPNLLPSGSCRICVVEVEGSSRLIGSCHTPIEPGMVIQTRSPKVLAARKATVELLLAGHTGPCVNDLNASECELHKLASDIQVGAPRFRMRKPRNFMPEEANPYIKREMSKCILCARCVSVCRDLAKKNLFSPAYRGFRSKIVVDFDGSLDKEICRDCLLCIDYCPTSALARTGPMDNAQEERKQASLPMQMNIYDRQRANLLPLLNKAQANLHCVSQGVVTDAAQSMNLSISDVYGVATFYSYLSTRPTGEFVIRVCKSLPCCLENSQAIVQSLEEQLGIKSGETTPDGLFSLELVNCIGACDQAPAMLINDEVHGKLTPKKISKILKSCRLESQPGGE